MNYLIGDIGNTNIKICKLNKKFKIIKTYFFSTKNSGLEINFKKHKNQSKNFLSFAENLVNVLFTVKKKKIFY